MGKIVGWLLKFLPEDYKFGVVLKKAAYTVGKLAIAGLMYGKVGTLIGSKLTPDQVIQIQSVAGAITAAALTAVHDWLSLKYPDYAWL